MRIGHAIKEARERAGLTQTEVAERLGISRNAISLWESNKSRPATANLLRLEHILQAEIMGRFQDSTENVMQVPVVSWVSAGAMADQPTVEAWAEYSTIGAVGLPPGDWIALKVDGTSMNRIAPPGSVIFVDKSDREPVAGKDFVFATEMGGGFKRYRTSPPRFEPFSTDADHETIFPTSTIKIIGRVKRVQIDV